jgi:formamidopyrimidine-DNA glycosylase
MPELPEVTTISEDVRALAAGRKVVRAEIMGDDVSNAGVEGFRQRLVGKTLRGTGRRGKIFTLDFGDVVGLIHLVISGRVLRLPEWREPDRTNTAVIEFEGGDGEAPVVLIFAKLWLGYFDLYEPERVDNHPLISRLGPDPFSEDFSVEYLTGVFGRKAAIKGLLLDQSVVAGLGNIYVDEVLFAAGVHPTRKANTLSREEVRTIYTATRDILGRAIELRGTTFDSYHDAFGEGGKFQYQLKVFARAGEPCPVCSTEILKLRVAGRGTHVCPVCQPL